MLDVEYNKVMQLSRYFTLADLTVTNTGLENSPDSARISNLKDLAQRLDFLKDRVGDFRVASAFRSEAVNRAVGGSATSLHKEGLAADLIPIGISTHEFVRRTLPFKDYFGEISDKEGQGAIHITSPAKGIQGKVTTGEYVVLGGDKLKEIYGFVSERPMVVLGGVLLLFAAIQFYRSRKNS